MHLDIGSFSVNKIVFDSATALDGDVLRIDRAELKHLVEGDPRIAQIQIDIVETGESARIIHVCDAIEPRIKISGPGCCYPGVAGSTETVGKGVTHRLSGMSVVISAEYP